MAQRFKIILVLIAALLFSGCVYYNTFFLARKNYRRAEKIRKKEGGDVLPAAAKPMYEKSIDKSLKVLTYYMETDYVDDALYMLGMCYLRMGEYTKALLRFNELLGNFPGSEYVDDSRYWRNVCLYYGGEEELAVDSLKAYALENPERAEDALFIIGEMAYQKEDYIEAKSAFLEFLEIFPKSNYIPKVHMRLGQIDWHFEEYASAAEHLEYVSEEDLPREDFFTIQKLLAQCYIKIGKLDKAESLLNALLKDETYLHHWSECELLIGDVEYARGHRDEALDIWHSLTEKYPRTVVAGWAYYKMGELYFDEGDLTLAKEMFDAAAQETSDKEVRELAQQRSAQIAKLLEYRNQIANADSLGINVVAVELALAEMYLTELDQPDSSISAYKRIIENYPDDSLASKANYSLGWVWAYSKKDFDTADTVFTALLQNYPETDYAVGEGDYFKSRGGSLDSLAARNVAYYFIKAEEFWLTYGWLDSALVYYNKVCDSFPDSRWIARAMAAKAGILIILGRTDEATLTYQELSAKFTGTEYDSLAKFRLGESVAIVIDKQEAPKIDSTIYALADTQATQESDTFRGTYENLPRAPRPIKQIRLRYPEAEWSSRYQGQKIRLKIKIDPFGKVTDVQLLRTCGNSVIDDAGIMAARKAEFDASLIDIAFFNTWFVFDIPVQKPTPDYMWDDD